MLRVRIAVTLFLLPILLWIIAMGNWLYVALVTLGLAISAAEYNLLFRRSGLRPSLPMLVGGVIVLALGRRTFGLDQLALALGAVILLSMLWHIVDFERGAPH